MSRSHSVLYFDQMGEALDVANRFKDQPSEGPMRTGLAQLIVDGLSKVRELDSTMRVTRAESVRGPDVHVESNPVFVDTSVPLDVVRGILEGSGRELALTSGRIYE